MEKLYLIRHRVYKTFIPSGAETYSVQTTSSGICATRDFSCKCSECQITCHNSLESSRCNVKHSLSVTSDWLQCLEISILTFDTITNLNRVLKWRDITLPTKVCLVEAMFFQWSCMDVRVGLYPYIENPKDPTRKLLMNIVKFQDIKLTHRNPLHSYTITMRKQKEKLRKQYHSPLQQKE